MSDSDLLWGAVRGLAVIFVVGFWSLLAVGLLVGMVAG